MTPRTDIHQHLWTEPLVAALARRDSPPFARRVKGGYVVYSGHEAPATVEVGAPALERRLDELDRDDVGRALVSLSSPIGVEGLPRREAEWVIGAYEQGIAELPSRFDAWAAIPLDGADPADVDRWVDAGFVGVSLPAGTLSTPRDIERLGPVLDRLAARDAPLFVHPGPGFPSDGAGANRIARTPSWWPALTSYVFEMQSAWLAFLVEGRPAHPRLRVVFAMLAGCAPLHRERLAGRGGPACRTFDPLAFYDCSSYGSQALDAMVRCVGIEQIVFGSDRPVVEPPTYHLGPAAHHAITVTNPARLLDRQGVIS